MQLIRKEDISVYLYIKDQVLGPRYAEPYLGASLTQVSSNVWEMSADGIYQFNPFTRPHTPNTVGDGFIDYTGLGRGLLYFDYLQNPETNTDPAITYNSIFGSEQTNIVKIYNGSIMASGYRINYKSGQIQSNNDLSNYLVDYQWNYLSVIDAWPSFEVPPLPIVTVEMLSSQSEPYQLGYGDIRDTMWRCEIFGTNKVDRDDIVEQLRQNIYLHRAPLYNLPSGMPLDYQGYWNPNFDTSIHPNYTALFFDKVEVKLSGLPNWGFYQQEDINRFRVSINFRTQAYKQ